MVAVVDVDDVRPFGWQSLLGSAGRVSVSSGRHHRSVKTPQISEDTTDQ